MVSDCRYLAVDVGQNPQVSGEQLTALIDAVTGMVVAAPLANNTVWAQFPSVNQANPSLVTFAGSSSAIQIIIIRTSTMRW